MQRMKRWLASVLSVLMLVSALPVTAVAESASWTDMVTYNLLNCPIQIGSDALALENGELDDLFDENGDYTIRLENNALFPYEIQFTYQGRTWEEWFMSPDDYVVIGGHTFYVSSERTDPHALVQIGFHVGSDFVLAYPEKKQFSTMSADHDYSLLPLREVYLNLNLTRFFPEELKEMSIGAVASMLSLEGNIGAWARWHYYDEDGRHIIPNDNYVYVVSNDTTIDLTDKYNDYDHTLELIVGNGDQLNPKNMRYFIKLDVSNEHAPFEFTAYTDEELTAEIDINISTSSTDSTANGRKYWLYADKADVIGTDSLYFQMNLAEQYTDRSFVATVYQGSFQTMEDILAAGDEAVDITDQIWKQTAEDQSQNSYRYELAAEGPHQFTVVLKLGDKVIYVEPMEFELVQTGYYLSYENLYAEENNRRTYAAYSRSSSWINEYKCYNTNIILREGYPADGIYYHNLNLYLGGQSATGTNGIEGVEKAFEGYYADVESIPDDAVDIKDQLFSDAYTVGGGYGVDCSQGVVFTVLDTLGDLHHIMITTVDYASTLSLEFDSSIYAAGGTDVTYRCGIFSSTNEVKYTLYEGYSSDDTLYLSMSLEGYSTLTDRGIAYVEKAVVGHYADAASIPADAANIKDQLFSDDGYGANYSKGVDFTVLDINGGLHHVKVTTIGAADQLTFWGATLYMESENDTRKSASKYQSCKTEAGRTVITYTMNSGYQIDGTYYAGLSMYGTDGQYLSNYGLAYIEKAVLGDYADAASIPSDAVDVKDQLFSGTYYAGYSADFSKDVTFTILFKDGRVFHVKLQTKENTDPVASAPTPLSSDTYFYVEGAQNAEGDWIGAYVMPYDADSYYYNGYQTVFLLNETYDSISGEYVTSPVTEDTVIPSFYTGSRVNVFAGHNGASGVKQISGETAVNFESGSPIHYSAAAEDRAHLKNYWVTFLTQQSGAKLFVNGATNSAHLDEETGMPVREVFMNDRYGNHHDIFIANIGDEDLTGLYVKLENAENVKLDEYWTIYEDGTTNTSAALVTEKNKNVAFFDKNATF